MNQSAVLRYAYESILKMLEEFGCESGLFVTSDSCVDTDMIKNAVVKLGVSDICQLVQDKNGERVIVDEIMYEVPSLFAAVVYADIYAHSYAQVLEAAGAVAGFLKDNAVIDAGEHNWHGNTDGKIYIEPVIRRPEFGRYVSAGSVPFVRLEYCFEAGINSSKGGAFRRVEKRQLTGRMFG